MTVTKGFAAVPLRPFHLAVGQCINTRSMCRALLRNMFTNTDTLLVEQLDLPISTANGGEVIPTS